MQRFIGRTEWLERFARYRQQEDGIILRITGQPGIGKTTLFWRFIQECEQQKVAHVFLDMENFAPTHGFEVLQALAHSARFFDTEKTNKSVREKMGEYYDTTTNVVVGALELSKDFIPGGTLIHGASKVLVAMGRGLAGKNAQLSEQEAAAHPELYLLKALAAAATPERRPVCLIDSYEHLLKQKAQIKSRLVFGQGSPQDTAERTTALSEWLGKIWAYLESCGWRVVLLGREVPLSEQRNQLQRFNDEEILAAAREREALRVYLPQHTAAILKILKQLSFEGNPLWLQVGMNLLENLLRAGKDLEALANQPDELQECFEEEDPFDTDSYEGLAHARCKLVLISKLTQHIPDLEGQAWKIALPRLLTKHLVKHLFPPEQANAILHSYKLAGVFRETGEQFSLHEEIRDLLLAYARSKSWLHSAEAQAIHTCLWDAINQHWKLPELLKEQLAPTHYHTIYDPPCAAITAENRLWILEACYHQCLGVTSLAQTGLQPEAFADQLLSDFRLSPLGKYQIATALSTAGLTQLQALKKQFQDSHQRAVKLLGSKALPRLYKDLADGLLDDPLRNIDYWQRAVSQYGDIGAYLGLKTALGETKGSPEQILAVLDELLLKYGSSTELEEQLQCARALVDKGLALWRQKNITDALASYSDCVYRYGSVDLSSVQEVCARALINKGFILGRQGDLVGALESYNDCLSRYGTVDFPLVQAECAKALVNKGLTLGRHGDLMGALEIYAECLSRYGVIDFSLVQAQCAKALVNQGATLGQQGDWVGALASYADCVHHYGAMDFPLVQAECAKALANQGATLNYQGNLLEALESCADCIRRYGKVDFLLVQAECARVLVIKGSILGHQGNLAGALDSYGDCIRRYGLVDFLSVQVACAKALVNQGVSLWQQGDSVGALASYTDCIRRYGVVEGGYQDQDTPVQIKKMIKVALMNSAELLILFDQAEAGVAHIQQVLPHLAPNEPDYVIMQFLQWLALGGSWQSVWESLAGLEPETEFNGDWTDTRQIIAKLPSERRGVAECWLRFFEGQQSREVLWEDLLATPSA